MSIESEAVVVSGYKIPRDIWQKGFEYCENHYKDPSFFIPSNWEDLFIDMDPISGVGDTLFGAIIYSISEDSPVREFDTVIAKTDTISSIYTSFHAIFDSIYAKTGFPQPTYNKYIGLRWY